MENKKTTESFVAETKAHFESPVIEFIVFECDDVITSSGGFPGEDDPILPPHNF